MENLTYIGLMILAYIIRESDVKAFDNKIRLIIWVEFVFLLNK